MAAERGALLCQVGVDIEHAAVILAHQAETVVLHYVHDASGFQPLIDFIPCRITLCKRACDLKEGDMRSPEYARDFRNRTGLAPGQPFAGHAAPVLHPIEGGIIDGGAWGEI